MEIVVVRGKFFLSFLVKKQHLLLKILSLLFFWSKNSGFFVIFGFLQQNFVIFGFFSSALCRGVLGLSNALSGL